MNIIYKKLDEIIPYVNNPRKNDKAVDSVALSIENYGFKVPIVIDQKNEIVTGHTRYKASVKLGLKEVPCIIADDLTPAQIKAYRIADNKVSEASEWDMELVKIELDGLKEFTGFDLEDFNVDNKEQEYNTIEAIENINVPITKRGDIWKLGNHRLMCGDSTNLGDVKKLMNGNKGKILFTSPPYSDMRDYNGNKDLSINNLIKFIPIYKEFTNYQVINLGIQRKDHEIQEYWNEYIKKAKECKYKFLAWNVWNKNSIMSIGQYSSFFPISHEWIFVFGTEFYDINLTWEKKEKSISKKMKKTTTRQKDGTLRYTNVGDASNYYKKMESVLSLNAELSNNRKLHPAIFPIELPSEYIKSMTNKKEIIIEPFGGSGTTMIACQQNDRICYMMELDERYCDVIRNRWEQFTGEEAIKIE
jgi:DNA modification methylase